MDILDQLNSTMHLADIVKGLPRNGQFFGMKNVTKKGVRNWTVNLSPPKKEVAKLKGVKKDTSHLAIFRIWDVKSQGFRTVNTRTLFEISFMGSVYERNEMGIWSKRGE